MMGEVTPAKTARNAEIHRRCRRGEPHKIIAHDYGISVGRVSAVYLKWERRLRESWRAQPRIADPDFPAQEYKGHWIGGMTLGEGNASR